MGYLCDSVFKEELLIVSSRTILDHVKGARDLRTQAVVDVPPPAPLFSEDDDLSDIFLDEGVLTLTSCLGAGLVRDLSDVSELRYDRVLVAATDDVEGSRLYEHVLTIVHMLMRQVLESGRVYVPESWIPVDDRGVPLESELINRETRRFRPVVSHPTITETIETNRPA